MARAPAVEDIHQQPVQALEGAPDRFIFQAIKALVQSVHADS
jgi:hypothetical protein